MERNREIQLFYMLNEILYGMRFHDSIKNSFIPEDMSFSFKGGAIDYIGAYYLFRILNDFRPQCILELGLGQSTKIISSYILNEKDNYARHRDVEHDNEWINHFCSLFDLPEKTELVKLELLKTNQYSENTYTYKYKGFLEELGDLCYDFIFIDGPYGWNKPEYSRVDCLDLIPDSISDSFVIMFHDVGREGEKRTFELIKNRLELSGYTVETKMFQSVGLIVSKDNRFLCWI